MKSVRVLLAVSLLSGCVTTGDRQPETNTVTRIAVPEECRVAIPVEPPYAYDVATVAMQGDEKLRRMRAELLQRADDQQRLRKLLQACTEAAK